MVRFFSKMKNLS